jgi:enamine deaminase RidA (YjgF/YER057c/UK114 family)
MRKAGISPPLFLDRMKHDHYPDFVRRRVRRQGRLFTGRCCRRVCSCSGHRGQGDTVQEQCRAALETIKIALAQAGATMADAVRVTYYLPDRTEFEPCWPILREAFGANPPVATMLECGLIDPFYRIEIELTALLPEHGIA